MLYFNLRIFMNNKLLYNIYNGPLYSFKLAMIIIYKYFDKYYNVIYTMSELSYQYNVIKIKLPASIELTRSSMGCIDCFKDSC